MFAFRLFAAFLIWAIRGWCAWRGRVRIIRRPLCAEGEP
ncbi:MAG: hypothetical protein JWM16_6287, partial [Verrucomicrobiales bacterium]|nr:hypothetical protein [Verrucomicrobiales bacterium]